MHSFLSDALAVLFALASALTLAWGTVVRHRIAQAAPSDGSVKGSPLFASLTNPLWWAGTSTALLGYGFQMLAMAFGTLLIVQPVITLSLLFTLPLEARVNRRRVPAVQMAWAALLALSVAVLVIVGRPIAGQGNPSLARWLVPIAIGAVVMAGITRLSFAMLRGARAVALGLVTGALFGYVAVFSKGVVDIAARAPLTEVALNWQTYALVTAAAMATGMQQYAFAAGPLKNSMPAMTITPPLTGIVLGYVILGERFQVVGAMPWAVLVLAVLAMIIATVALSRGSVGR